VSQFVGAQDLGLAGWLGGGVVLTRNLETGEQTNGYANGLLHTWDEEVVRQGPVVAEI